MCVLMMRPHTHFSKTCTITKAPYIRSVKSPAGIILPYVVLATTIIQKHTTRTVASNVFFKQVIG